MINLSDFIDAVNDMVKSKKLEKHEVFKTLSDDDFFKFKYGLMSDNKKCLMLGRYVAKETLLNAEPSMLDYFVRCVSRIIDQGRKMAEVQGD